MPIAKGLLRRPPAARKAEALPGRRLAEWPEAAILASVGSLIRPRYPIGSATLWHRHAGSIGEKRIAEALAGLIFEASGDDPLAQRISIAGANAAGALAPAPMRELIIAAFGQATAEINREIAEVKGRLASIRQRRTRAALRDQAEQRRAAMVSVREIESAIAGLHATRREAKREVESGRITAKAFAHAEYWTERRNMPRLRRDLAAAKDMVPSYRLTAGQHRRLEEFADRLYRLRAVCKALGHAARDLGRKVPRSLGAAA